MGAGTLKSAHQPMGRTKMGLDAQKLLINGSGGVGGDLRAACPSHLAVSLDGLSDRLRVAREEVCQDKKEVSRKNQMLARPIV